MLLGVIASQAVREEAGAPEEPDDGTWFTAIETAVTGNSTLSRPRNVRQLLTVVAGSTGDLVRITFRLGTSSGDMTVESCYIGHGATSGDAYDFEATPTPVTFGGLTSFVLPWTSGLDHVSDEIDFSLDETKPLLITFYVAGDYAEMAAVLGGGTFYDKGGADETGTVDVSSYGSGQSAVRTIKKVEVFIPESTGGGSADDDEDFLLLLL